MHITYYAVTRSYVLDGDCPDEYSIPIGRQNATFTATRGDGRGETWSLLPRGG